MVARPWFGVLLALSLLSGCAEKARTVTEGAKAFESEGLKTVALLDDMRKREVTPPTPMSPAEARRRAAEALVNGNGAVTAAEFTAAADTLDPPSSSADVAWTTYLNGLRAGYRAFGAAFDSLEAGSFLARDAVPRAVPVLDRLTADALAIADHVHRAPPRFLPEREDIAAEMSIIRMDGGMTTAAKTTALEAQAGRLEGVLKAEREAQVAIVAQAVRTATVAQTLRPALKDYATLSMQDVSEAVAFAFSSVSGITGKDYGAVLGRLKTYRDDLMGDPARAALLEASLAELSKQATAR